MLTKREIPWVMRSDVSRVALRLHSFSVYTHTIPETQSSRECIFLTLLFIILFCSYYPLDGNLRGRREVWETKTEQESQQLGWNDNDSETHLQDGSQWWTGKSMSHAVEIQRELKLLHRKYFQQIDWYWLTLITGAQEQARRTRAVEAMAYNTRQHPSAMQRGPPKQSGT